MQRSEHGLSKKDDRWWQHLSSGAWKPCHFNPIKAKGDTLCPSPKSQHMFKTAWSLELLLCDFYFYAFSIQKSSVPPISTNVCCHGSHATFRLFWKLESPMFFQVFPPQRNFLWNNCLCFGHPNTLKSLIIANIRTVTMETFQKIILPKYGHQH